MEAAQNRRRDDSMAVGELVAARRHQSIGRRIRKPRSQAAVRAPAVVQLDNATPTILSLEKSGTRGIHGSVGLSRFMKRSPKAAVQSVDAALRISAMTDRWKCRHGCLKPPPVLTCV